ncbi:MAG: M60 family metallopeptidase [Clostridium sp.]
MKKIIASIILLSMLALPMNAFALGKDVLSTDNDPISTTDIITGKLEVDINFKMPIKNTSKESTKLNLVLKSKTDEVSLELGSDKSIEESEAIINGNTINYTVKKLNEKRGLTSIGDTHVYYYNIEFNNLPLGNYNIELLGAGFNNVVEKNIQVKDYSQRVIMNNNEVLLFGDFDNDDKVDESDYNNILENMDTTDENLITEYDLNRDGVVDILDLHYVHQNVSKSKSSANIINTDAILNPSTIELEKKEGQEIVGEVKDLINDEGVLQISSVDETNNKVDITPETPVEVTMKLDKTVEMEQIIIKSPVDGSGPASGEVVLFDESGIEVSRNDFGAVGFRKAVKSNAGTIKIDLGKQVAVKKITIVVKETTKDPKLAEIAKVEFLNNVYDEIPEPELNIPTIKKVEPDNELLKLSWNHEANVTGYEIVCKALKDGKEEIRQTTSNTIEFKDLKNYEEYELRIKSINGDWSSDFSAPIIGVPKPQEKPTAPEGISVEGLYKGIKISWKKNDMAIGQNLYYRKANSDEEYTEIKSIVDTSHVVSGLENETTYEVYLTAYNEIGTSNKSNVYTGKTLSIDPPISPNYNLINTAKNIGELTNHIVDVDYVKGVTEENYPSGKIGVVDNDYSTYWYLNDWDAGVYSKRGPIITFDDEYTIDTIALIPRQEPGYNIPYQANIGVWDEVSQKWTYNQARITSKNNNGAYVLLQLDEPIKSNKIQINPSVYGGNKVSISELKIYNYDSIENDIKNLFKDDLQVEIKDSVTQTVIDELRTRLNTVDSISGEYHWNKTVLEKELKLAEDILNDKGLSQEIFTVEQNITNGTFNQGMGNDYQALGYSVRTGEEIVVYVGTKGNILPELIFTQYYGESGKFAKTVKLQKGRNVIEVPKIHDLDVEKGGSMYVRYPNKSISNNEIKVRVSGGTKIPHLNLYNSINDETLINEVKDSIRSYIDELKKYVDELEGMYPFFKNKSQNKYKFDKETSVLNTTDIELQKVTLNLPATEILKGITTGLDNEEEQVERVYQTLLAWEQMMDITFAKKGILGTDIEPRSRMNIKYQRMFGKAFMYASNNHVGIGFNSSAPLMQGKPYTFNEDGTLKESGELFGWGISHEIGHVTDKPKGTYSETTNNMLALIVQTFDDKAKSRLEDSDIYEKMYEKVTSNTVALPSNVFVSLGMFWQLHLAYEDNHTYEMLWNNDSYYGRLNKAYREMPSEMASLHKDQILVRLASDVAEKDLTDFFYKWGIRPTEETYEYVKAKGYEKEIRQIQYLNDEARRQRLSGVKPMSSDTKVEATFDKYSDGDYVKDSKSIVLNLGTTGDEEKILGYEIYRNGVPVGFTTENTFTDIIGASNNRVFNYEVVAYDYLLNTTEKENIGSLKISHDGSISKTAWSVNTNTLNDEDKNNGMDTTGPVMNPSINKAIDNKLDTVYVGGKDGKLTPEIIIEMNEVSPIVGIKYATNDIKDVGTIENYEVHVSNDGENWTLANSGKFDFGNHGNDNNTATVYFNQQDSEGGRQLWTYEASYVKLVAKGMSTILVAELDVLAPPGDNIDIETVGKLKSDYEYAEGQSIPAGSVIITGEYRGNPAYNIPVLKDVNGYVISSETILLAEIPVNAHIGEISSGTWISWIPEAEISKLTNKVMAELYRVNDAITLEGQRLVSDSMYVEVPKVLPEIEFTKGE